MKSIYIMSSKTTTQIPSDFTFESWEDDTLNLKPQLLRGLYAFGFDQPSPIQKKAVGPMIAKDDNGARKDIIAQAQSGTGKTGAFSVSVLEIVDAKNDNTQALILAPTHELANQIKNVITSLGNFLKIRIQLLVGGTSVDDDKNKLENDKPQIVVGTPGRVHDMIRRKYLQTEHKSVLVLDEATSALDNETEARVMQNIYGLRSDLTMFMVAHRLSTLSHCDRIFRVSRDGILAEIDKSDVLV